MNSYTDKEIEDLINISIGLNKIIEYPEESNKKTIEKILNLSKNYLYLPKISKMQKEVQDYYSKRYDNQLSLKFDF